MSSYDVLAARVRDLTESRFKDFEHQLLSGTAEAERNAVFQKKRLKRRREFLESIGMDLKKFDTALTHESRGLDAELKAFLEEFRPQSVSRPSAAADAARDAAIRSAVLGESGHTVLPAFASSIFTPDRVSGEVAMGPDWNPGAIDSGWVFQDPPQIIRIKDSVKQISLCWSTRYTPPPVYSTYFTFVPASTATYEMTAVIAYHGFYVLVADDSWWNCRYARVTLKAQMNVHQYSDGGWKDFPPLLNVEKQNAQEVDNFDRTFFFDYTTALRAGDPVVVTVRGTVEGFSDGGSTHAELNFQDGTANFIQPLFLSVTHG
jgi:hypothetical protein